MYFFVFISQPVNKKYRYKIVYANFDEAKKDFITIKIKKKKND